MNVVGEEPLLARRAVAEIAATLAEVGIPTARAEAEWLVADAVGLTRTEVYLHDTPLGCRERRLLHAWVTRRCDGEPLQYLAGWADFCGHHLLVNRSVLIPRPETELLAQAAIEWLRRDRGDYQSRLRVLELGTGSGAIAITVAAAVPTCLVVGVELSWEALRTAQANVVTHRLADRIRLVQSDWASGLSGSYDLLVANPPYLDEAEAALVALGGEPRLSLDGGSQGLAWVEPILRDTERLVRSGGVIGIECAAGQADGLCRRAQSQTWVSQARIYRDLTGRPRGLWITRR